MTKQTAAGRARAKPLSPGEAATKSRPPGRTSTRRRTKPTLTEVVLGALDDLKAQNVVALDVRDLTDITDTIVIASGTSDRHVKSLAGRVLERVAEAGYRPLGLEGQRDGEWVLVDLQDVVVHLMLPRVREFYGLEKLWGARAGERAANG